VIERRRRGEQWLAAVALLLFLGVADLQAQVITSASISGSVRGSDGLPVAQALVTITATGGFGDYQTTTSSAGTFSVGLVQPGSYELRIEALGYRPLVARTLSVSGGDERSLSFIVTAEPPPVTRVDTIAISGGVSTRVRAGGIQFAGSEIDGLPSRFNDFASVAALSTAFGRGSGAQGLPGDMTLVFADGMPVYRAPHPTAREELIPNALFPRSVLTSVRSIHNGTDVEWSGAAGGYIASATRTSTSGGGVELDGAWSGDPVWSSSELDISAPSLLSFTGGARGMVDVGDSGTLLVSGEAVQHEAPLAPRVGEALAAQLSSLDPVVLGGIAEPAVESYRRYSGLARLDLQTSSTNRVFFRGAGAFSERSFDGAGPVLMGGLSAPAEESVDFSTVLGVVSTPSRRTAFEFRAGFSGSARDFGSAMEGAAPAYLTESAVALGNAHSAFGESSRTDFVVAPVLRYDVGTSSLLKFGTTIRASRHTMAHSPSSRGDAVFSSPTELRAGQGFARASSAPEESFGTQEYGLFAQYEGTPAANVRMVLGGRYDFERITGDGAALNQEWFDATGLRSDEQDTGYHQFGARFSLGWDPSGTGSTRVMIGASLHEGDLDTRAVYQVLAEDIGGTSTRYTGSMLGWPDGGIPLLATPALPSLTLLGPDARAPRTTNLSLSVSQRMGDVTSVFLGASTRRTDFLMRRRNLNVPIVPQGLDPWGRSMFGSLGQTGATVIATSDDARRFSDFGEVWALDPDGWSEYVGVTAGLEHTTRLVELYASYTWSETTDNWIGAASGTIGGTLDPGLAAVDGGTPWAEGISDFDRPHRAVGRATVHAGPVSLSALYRFESGAPFTPGYRLGVDANGDGSMRNDVAFVPSGADLDGLAGEWTCLSDQAEAFASRNSCRGPDWHTLDARIQFRLGSFAGRTARLTVDGFNLIESRDEILDNALLLVDPSGAISVSPDGETITIPTVVNSEFGQSLYNTGRGRMIRIGVRIGG
jgi:hypothetical protein